MGYYDDIAEGYEELHREEQEKKVAVIRAMMDELGWRIQKKDTVLDVGCGTGVTTACWEGKKTGIDPANKLLEKAKQAYPKITFVEGIAEALPFHEQSFDWVVSVTALQNFTDPEKGLAEMKRVGKEHWIISFLKKSPKKDVLIALVEKTYRIVEKVEEEKDILFFLSR